MTSRSRHNHFLSSRDISMRLVKPIRACQPIDNPYRRLVINHFRERYLAYVCPEIFIRRDPVAGGFSRDPRSCRVYLCMYRESSRSRLKIRKFFVLSSRFYWILYLNYMDRIDAWVYFFMGSKLIKSLEFYFYVLKISPVSFSLSFMIYLLKFSIIESYRETQLLQNVEISIALLFHHATAIYMIHGADVLGCLYARRDVWYRISSIKRTLTSATGSNTRGGRPYWIVIWACN